MSVRNAGLIIGRNTKGELTQETRLLVCTREVHGSTRNYPYCNKGLLTEKLVRFVCPIKLTDSIANKATTASSRILYNSLLTVFLGLGGGAQQPYSSLVRLNVQVTRSHTHTTDSII